METNNQATIQLKRDSILKIGILDEEGNPTGEHLEFDLEDIGLTLRYQEAIEKHKRNVNALKMSLALIDKKQNHTGKKLLSSKEEEKVKTVKEFYRKEMEVLDMYLGQDGCKKILNGRQPYYSMFDDINDMLEPVLPIIQEGFKKAEDKMKAKYTSHFDDNVLM